MFFVSLRLQKNRIAVAEMTLGHCAPMFDFLETARKRKNSIDGIVTIGAACAPGEEPK